MTLLAGPGDYIVDSAGKAAVAEVLSTRAAAGGSRLLCVGDSRVDLEMLSLPTVEAVVVPRRADMLAAVSGVAGARQLVYEGVPVSGVLPVVTFPDLAVMSLASLAVDF